MKITEKGRLHLHRGQLGVLNRTRRRAYTTESFIDIKREIAELQEQISLMSAHILNKREENEKYTNIIKSMCRIN